MVLLLLVGCVVSQEEQAAVLAERDTAQAKVISLQSDLNKAQEQVGSLQSEVTTAQGQYSTLKSDLKSLSDSLDEYLSLNTAILIVNAGLLEGDLGEVEAQSEIISAKLSALGNIELEALWQQAYMRETERWDLHFGPFVIFMARFDDMIVAEAKKIKDKLSQ